MSAPDRVWATFGFDISPDVQWEIEVEGTVYFDPGERATWGYAGGSPEVPPSWEADVERLWVIHDGATKCRRLLPSCFTKAGLYEAAAEALIAEECAQDEGRRDAAAEANYDAWHDEHD